VSHLDVDVGDDDAVVAAAAVLAKLASG